MAAEFLAEMLPNASAAQRGRSWLARLINQGPPELPPLTEPEDGGLLVSYAEAETHVFAFHALVKAVCQDGLVDLSGESSDYHFGAFSALHNDLRKCRFTTADQCSREFMNAYGQLLSGSPQFGHRFQSDWSFYSIVPRDSLIHLLDGLEEARRFERRTPEDLPSDVRATVVTKLSDAGVQFVEDLQRWLKSLHDEGLDAYVIWW